MSVSLAGTIVAKKIDFRWIKYTIGDGTGLIDCTQFSYESNGALKNLVEVYDLGQGITVWGQIKSFQGNREV